MTNFGTHPKEYFKNYWYFHRILFILSVIIGMIIDFIPLKNLFGIRMSLISITIISFIWLMIMEYRWANNRANRRLRRSMEYNEFQQWYDIYKYADNLFHQRFHFFMVAESMLIMSFATAIILLYSQKGIIIAIAILGLLFTFSWAYINRRFDFRLMFLNQEYLPRFPKYKEYLKSVSLKTIPTGMFLTNLLPTFTFFFWYLLLYYVY